MFGVKKTLTISNDKNKSDFTDRDISISHSGEDSKFIYYAKKEKFMSKLEIYIKPNNYPDKKVLIITKSEIDFKELYSQIKENLKSISEYKNVAGLKIENLYKEQNESRIYLPKDGKIGDYLKSGDIIYCDVTSDEFWIKTYFKIRTYEYKKIIKLEYKFQKKMKFKQIKLILLKAGIELFLDEIKNNNLDNSFNYFVKGIRFHNKKRKKTQGVEFVGVNKKLKYLDSKNEILVDLKFGIFEELIHEQLASMELNKNENNYLRLNEYCNLIFTELLTSKKFEPELATVQDISVEFLTSQYNDLNTPFLFYNCKRRETVDEYMYNMINITNSYEQDMDDDEEDDEFDFEGDTSFGKFYSEDPSKYFGNITSIKKTKYNKKHNKFDSNMIILAPFLFKLIKNNNINGLGINNYKHKDNTDNNKIFRTFANTKEKAPGRQKQDLNNFFITPLSLENNGNNLLIDDHNNLFYNDEDNDLILYTGNNGNNIINDDNPIEKDPMKDIYLLDNDVKNKDKRYTVKIKDTVSSKSKKTIVSLMRLSKQSNCCNDLYNSFSQIEFIENLKKKYKFYISKKILEKINIPESRDYENIDKDFLIFLTKKENEEDNSLIVKNKKLIFFLIIFFIYYLLMIVTVNFELINLFI